MSEQKDKSANNSTENKETVIPHKYNMEELVTNPDFIKDVAAHLATNEDFSAKVHESLKKIVGGWSCKSGCSE